ncbi:MAG TPA: hypothetical protein VHA74_01920 [Candidatus Dojkabacteria bacterium]|nr:hypothetical protein [Candidatus Dojkabacteria bacterium]
MRKSLGIDSSSDFENNPHFEIIEDRELINSYLQERSDFGDNDAFETLVRIRTYPEYPIALIKCNPDYFYNDVDALFTILEDCGVFLDQEQFIDPLLCELDKVSLNNRVRDFYNKCVAREREAAWIIENTKNLFLPIKGVKLNPKYSLLLSYMESFLSYGIQGRTFIGIGGPVADIQVIDEVAFTLNPDNKEFFLKNHMNQFILGVYKDIKARQDSYYRLTHINTFPES